MKKYIVSIAISMTVMSLAIAFAVPAQTQAQVSCPAGYTCTPVSPQPTGCPAGFTCTPIATPAQACYSFTRNLGIGSSGDDVTNLTAMLTSQGFLTGKSYTYDETVASAVSSFQERYASEILTPNSLSSGTGYVGAATRSKLNRMCGMSGQTPSPTPSPSISVNNSNPNMSGGLCSAGQLWVTGSGCQNQPSITVTYPRGTYSLDDSGAKGNGNSPIATIQWTEQNGNYPVSIYLLDQNNQIVRTIVQNTPNTGSFVWGFDPTLPNGTYQIRIDIIFSGKGGPTSGYSGYFTVANSPASPANVGPTTISFVYPQAGYSLDDSGAKGNGNSPIATIQWNEQNGNYPVSIYLLNQSNQVVRTIATNIADTGSYVWPYDSTLPDGTYQLRIDVLYPSGVSGQDSAYSGYFTTANSPVSQPVSPVALTVIYPQAGYSLDASGAKGTGNSPIATIQWNEQNGDYPVFIYLLNTSNQIVRNIAQNAPDTGSYVWAYDPTLPDGTYQIQISVAYPGKGGPTNAYSGYFTVANSPASQPAAQATITITNPQSGYSLDASGAKGTGNSPIATIQWVEQNGNYPVSIALVNQNNQVVRTLTYSTPNTGSFVWGFDPTLPNGTYQLKMDVVYSGKGYSPSAYSGYFTVANSPAN